MTTYDAAMAAVVVAGLVWGAWRGITWQLASLASLVLGFMLAHPLSAQLAPHFPGPPIVARALALMAVYAAISGGIFLAAWSIRATLRKLKFEAFDRHLGMLLGGVEGLAAGMIVTLFVVSLAPRTRGPIFASPTGQAVCRVMGAVGPVLPTEVRDELGPFLNPGEAVASEATPPPPTAPEPDPAPAANRTDPAVAKARGLLEEGESRLGRAFVDTVEKELEGRGVANGGNGTGNVERR